MTEKNDPLKKEVLTKRKPLRRKSGGFFYLSERLSEFLTSYEPCKESTKHLQPKRSEREKEPTQISPKKKLIEKS